VIMYLGDVVDARIRGLQTVIPPVIITAFLFFQLASVSDAQQCTTQNVLVVAGGPPLSPADIGMLTFLNDTLGNNVTFIFDSVINATDADGFDIIVLPSSVNACRLSVYSF